MSNPKQQTITVCEICGNKAKFIKKYAFPICNSCKKMAPPKPVIKQLLAVNKGRWEILMCLLTKVSKKDEVIVTKALGYINAAKKFLQLKEKECPTSNKKIESN